jgi:hypothetical protein
MTVWKSLLINEHMDLDTMTRTDLRSALLKHPLSHPHQFDAERLSECLRYYELPIS